MVGRDDANEQEMKVEQVIAYAAAGDCLTEAYNNTTESNLRETIILSVNEFKKNSLSMTPQAFIEYTNSLMNVLSLYEEYKKRRDVYRAISVTLLNPTADCLDKLAAIFHPADRFTQKYRKDHREVCNLVRFFVDCHDEVSLKKMFTTIPDAMKAEMLRSLFPECFMGAINEYDPIAAHILLELGMVADTKYPWSNMFGDTTYLSFLTHIVYQAGQMISRVGTKKVITANGCHFNDSKLNACTTIITDLLAHGADPDFDKRSEYDDATPRGLAAEKIAVLKNNPDISAEDKEKMTAVLQLVTNHKREPKLEALETNQKRQKK